MTADQIHDMIDTTRTHNFYVLKAEGGCVSESREEGVTLEEAQKIVGGYVESIMLFAPGVQMLVDEDGKMKWLEPNGIASSIIQPQTIVGDALILFGKAMMA